MANGIINYESVSAMYNRLNKLTGGEAITPETKELLRLIETLMYISEGETEVSDYYKEKHNLPLSYKNFYSENITEYELEKKYENLYARVSTLYHALEKYYKQLAYLALNMHLVPTLVERLDEKVRRDYEKFLTVVGQFNLDSDDDE